MNQYSTDIGGLATVVVESSPSSRLIVILLHGYAMDAEALAPFASSLRLPATFLVPRGPVRAQPDGYAWWSLDLAARQREMAVGPRDLAHTEPPGAAAARGALVRFWTATRERWADLPFAIVGFSQGGMLACDAVLHDDLGMASLALLSSSRITIDEWSPRLQRLRDLPVLISHGLHDQDLAFTAGEALRDMAMSAGARVVWVPFDGGHEIPLVVWRALKKFLAEAVGSNQHTR